MVNLKFLLRLFPSTVKIEANEAELIKEYNDLEAYRTSDELKHYLELKEYVNSEAYKNIENELKSIDYKNSDEYKKENEFNALKKSAGIIDYFKVLNSKSYKNYLELKDSEKIRRYNELKAIISSDEFKKKQESIKNLNYKTSPEFKLEAEFLNLSKSKELKTYFAIIESEIYKTFTQLLASDDLKHFLALQEYAEKTTLEKGAKDEKIEEYNILKKDPRFKAYSQFERSKNQKFVSEIQSKGILETFDQLKKEIESEEFKNRKSYLSLSFKAKWEQTEEFVLSSEYTTISSDTNVKDYVKFIQSKEFSSFQETLKSGNVEKYEELENYLATDEFKDKKNYMLLPFKAKWGKTEASKKHDEYVQLNNSDKIKWYLKVENSQKFDELKKWKLIFRDEFDGDKLDSEIWLTRYYWGDNMLHNTYSLAEDLHYITDGANVSVKDSILKIETRKEKASGMAWNPLFGFVPKDFEYTSGTVNTGKSFRQQYGRFQAKIKMSGNHSTVNSFWMVGNQILPHIDVVKFLNNKLHIGNFWGNITEKGGVQKNSDSLSASKLRSDFFIFEVEWTPSDLTWKVNNLVIKKQTNGIPAEPMYLQLSGGVFKEMNEVSSSIMEIDWVRCYEKLEK